MMKRIFIGRWLASIFGSSFGNKMKGIKGFFKGIFTSDGQKFTKSELSHVPKVYWWNNEDHKKAVIACLVQATYVLEKDRRRPISRSKILLRRLFRSRSTSTTHLAPPWFEHFGFKLHSKVIDTKSKIFGAVYEYEHPQHRNGIPLYVIAFRGTSTKKDLQLDARIIVNGLHRCSRADIAMKKVEEIVRTKNSTVWLAGHSLGASMTMLVGKHTAMMEDGVFLESFLFNPPFPSVPTEQIKNTNIRNTVRTCKNIITSSLASVANVMYYENNQTKVSPFVALKDWVPYLFVNAGDYVCAEYIGYFEHREYMERIGLGGIGRVATQHSTWGAFFSLIFKEYPESLHRIQSANLTVNLKPSKKILEDHALCQWWRSDLTTGSTVY